MSVEQVPFILVDSWRFWSGGLSCLRDRSNADITDLVHASLQSCSEHSIRNGLQAPLMLQFYIVCTIHPLVFCYHWP